MKKPILFLILLFSLQTVFAQTDFTGTWKGIMIQDSPKRSIDFEIVLEEKEGKVIGYLYRLFIVNDTLIYNTVRVQARVVNNTLVVEDEKSVSKNFEEKADRIKVVYFFKLDKNRNGNDSLKGEWTTNRYKKYMAITGVAAIAREPNYLTTQIYKRLEEKKLHLNLAFTSKQRTDPSLVVAPVTNPTQPTATDNTTQTTVTKISTETKPINTKPNDAVEQKTNTTTIEPKPPTVDTIQTTVTKIGTDGKPVNTKPNASVQQKPNITTIQPKPEPASSSVANNNKAKAEVTVTNKPVVPVPSKPATQKPTVTQQPTATGTNPIVVIPQTEKPIPEISKTNQAQVHDSATAKQAPITIAPPPVINNPIITKRETEIIQTLAVYEDSVTLSLYDNGEIDGDTVSVFLDNEKVVANVGLTATAFKKTIYFKQGQIIQLTLFAENLGTIPPNTGLLVVYSGEKRYQVFFTSTLNKSAVILLRREQKP